MNYKKIYYSVIENAKSQNRIKHKGIYYENHHIIPRCLDGTNNKENLVLLTAREHYICHKLLTYIHKGNRKIALSFFYMTFSKRNNLFIFSRNYAYAKQLINLTPISDETRQKQSKSSKGKPKSEKTREKMKKHVFSKEHKQKLKKPKTEEHKQKLSIAKLGDLNPTKRPEVRQKIGKSNTGKKRTEEQNEKNRKLHLGINQSKESNEKRSKALKGKKQRIAICPHCKKAGGYQIMGRYHFDKCKFKINGK